MQQSNKSIHHVSERAKKELFFSRVGARITIAGLCITFTMGEITNEYVEANFPTLTYYERGLGAIENINSTVDDISDDVDAIDCSISDNFELLECY